ncbi:MAG: sulfatase-like hydrolase/transferase [Flavobacteriales bacterium]|nr:sulfatase-like hydrolase/transferase [Flavobacteriales bacterium]
MFKMVESTNYQTAYKGKWHMTKPTQFVNNNKKGSKAFNQLYWTKEDVPFLKEMYGINEWNYPDAGDDGNLFNFGGGNVNNDGRFVDGDGQNAWYGEKENSKEERIEASAVNYLKKVDTKNGENPFFLVVSLVNPHDVLAYPGNGRMVDNGRRDPLYKKAGYKDKDFKHLDVKLPDSWNDSLKTKPKVQKSWRRICQLVGPIRKGEKKRANNYVKFYAHLTSVVDQEINKVLNALEEFEHDENTLVIRISDHGDMGMAHGRQRQKMYNVYQQTLNVPLIFSHPKIDGSHSTESFAGLIDLMPTIADIVGANTEDFNLQGESLIDAIDNPNESFQDHVHFTFDDNYAVSNKPWSMGASHIRCIKQKNAEGVIWKYAVYFDPDYGQEMEYEMYNLTKDSDEKINLAHEDTKLDKETAVIIEEKRQELHQLLSRVIDEKGTKPDSVLWPEKSGDTPGK